METKRDTEIEYLYELISKLETQVKNQDDKIKYLYNKVKEQENQINKLFQDKRNTNFDSCDNNLSGDPIGPDRFHH